MYNQAMVEGLISAMARIMGPITNSVEGDIARVKGRQDQHSSEESSGV